MAHTQIIASILTYQRLLELSGIAFEEVSRIQVPPGCESENLRMDEVELCSKELGLSGEHKVGSLRELHS